jgi:protein TonB
LFAGGAIALAHAVAIYALATFAPRVSTVVTPPISLHFIAERASTEKWRPPPVSFVSLPLRASEPALAVVELGFDAQPTRAIDTHTPSAPTEENAGPSVPRLMSDVVYVREPAPRYPPQSRRLREEGVVVLRVLIDESGRVCEIAIESSSGYPRLDRAARDAVASAAFRPYFEGGAPRRAQALIPIEFSLTRRSA